MSSKDEFETAKLELRKLSREYVKELEKKLAELRLKYKDKLRGLK